MAKLSNNERREIERKLHNPKWRERLQRVQDIVQLEFEKFRDQAETLLIRAVIPRTQIKELPRVLTKINENRAKQPCFSVSDLEDLIAVKVLCPYPSDVEEVFKRMKNHTGFRVRPRSNREARREKTTGYRGYHFTVELKESLVMTNEDLMGIKCEIQLKTMLEEAWDAKTHEVIYRREEQINSELLNQMKIVSHDLAVLDENTEHLKGLISQREVEERERKEAVVAVYLNESMPLVEKIISKVPKVKELIEGKFTTTNVLNLIPVVQEYREKGKLSPALCRLAALVGLYATGKHMDVWALDICDELIRQEPNDPNAYLTKGSIYWALDQLDEALEVTEIGIEEAEAQDNHDIIAVGKGDFAYWVAEKAWKEGESGSELLERAKTYIETAIEIQPKHPGYLDTKGFLYIVTASKKEDIEKGHRLIKKARHMAMNTPQDKISKAFYKRHETIALLRLSSLE